LLTWEGSHLYAEYRSLVCGNATGEHGCGFLFDPAQLSIRILSALNRAFKEWHEVFPNAACVVSLIDRLVHRCEIVMLQGESYRLKEAMARAENKTASRASRKGKKS